MRDTLIIRRVDDSILLQAKLKDLPYKDDVIGAKSMELFADDDPCVIHRSFVIMQFAEDWKKAFASTTQQTVSTIQPLVDRLNVIVEPHFNVQLVEG